MSEEPKSKGWWKTVPGILTAFATFLTAITGLIVVINDVGGKAEESALVIEPNTEEEISSPECNPKETPINEWINKC